MLKTARAASCAFYDALLAAAAGSDYITLIPLGDPRRLTALSVESLAPQGEFILRGLSLVDTRTVDTHIKTLRAKLKMVREDLDPIVTHRGMGYSAMNGPAR